MPRAHAKARTSGQTNSRATPEKADGSTSAPAVRSPTMRFDVVPVQMVGGDEQKRLKQQGWKAETGGATDRGLKGLWNPVRGNHPAASPERDAEDFGGQGTGIETDSDTKKAWMKSDVSRHNLRG